MSTTVHLTLEVDWEVASGSPREDDVHSAVIAEVQEALAESVLRVAPPGDDDPAHEATVEITRTRVRG